MSKALEFYTQSEPSPQNPESQEVQYAVLSDPLSVTGQLSEVVIDGQTQPVKPEVARQISKTIVKSLQRLRQGNRVDCVAFGVMLAKGQYYGADRNVYLNGPMERWMAYHDLRPINEASGVQPLMEPHYFFENRHGLGMGIPVHMATPISEEKDLVIQKNGDEGIVISDFQTAAGFYYASHVAIVDGLLATTEGKRVLAYNTRATQVAGNQIIHTGGDLSKPILEQLPRLT